MAGCNGRRPGAETAKPPRVLNAIGRLWRGEMPLLDAFWNWAVFGGLVVNITTSLLFLLLITQGQAAAALLVGYGLSVPYNILVAVGVWRSAARDPGPPARAGLIRTVTLVGLLLLSVT